MVTERLRQIVALIKQRSSSYLFVLARVGGLCGGASRGVFRRNGRGWGRGSASSREFTRQVADPHDLVLDRLIAEARRQVAQGEARDLDESL